MHNWYGLYRIVEKLGPVHYRLRTNGNRSVATTVHANKMKLYFDPNDRPILPPLNNVDGEPLGAVDPRPFPQAIDGTPQGQGNDLIPVIDNQTIFNAEKLLDKRVKNGEVQNLVKWAGYPISEATLEPPENLYDPRLIQNFENEQQQLS